jgi:hypothetical protein
MMHAPTDNEILLAEQRLNESRRQMVAATSRSKAALRDALVKPGTLLGVAGASALAGYLLFRPPRVQRVNVSTGPSSTTTAATAAAASTSMAGIVMAFVMRYAMRQFSGTGMHMLKQVLRHNRHNGSGRSHAVVTPSSSGTVH